MKRASSTKAISDDDGADADDRPKKKRRSELDSLASTTGPDGGRARRSGENIPHQGGASTSGETTRRNAASKASKVMEMAMAAGAYDDQPEQPAPSQKQRQPASDAPAGGGLVLPPGWKYKQLTAPPGQEHVPQPWVWTDAKCHTFKTIDKARAAIERARLREEAADFEPPAAGGAAASSNGDGARSARAAGQAATAKAARIAAAEAANYLGPTLAIERANAAATAGQAAAPGGGRGRRAKITPQEMCAP